MAKDIKLLIKGSAERAEAAIRELQRTGKQSTHLLERDFKQLGISSSIVFDNQREAAEAAYLKIKKSGLATKDELKRAAKAHAAKLVEIDKKQYGKRVGMLDKFKGKHIAAFAAMGVAAAGYAAKRIADEALDAYQGYETALTDMAKVTDENLQEINDRIMDMPAELGSATDLMRGYYQVISAGVTDAGEAQELLTIAAKASKAAHVDQGETIKGLTKLMAGFSGEIATAAEASDLLFAIERLGQTSFAELVPIIGGIASVSRQAGASQYEMAAMMSQLTQTAGSTSQAATQYKAILMGLIKPQKNMTDMLSELGFESGQAAVEQLGLSGALQSLYARAESAGIGMGKLFESSEALTGIGPLLATEFGQYDIALQDITNSTGATDEAFADWMETMEATEEIFNNTVGKVMIELGRELAPTVNKSMRDFSDWVTEHKPEILQFFDGLGASVRAVAGFVGDLAMKLGETYSWYQAYQTGQIGFFEYALTSSAYASSSGRLQEVSGSAPSITDRTDGPLFPGYAIGTSYVPRTGVYQLHRGEEVRTRGEVSRDSQQSSAPSISFGDVNLTLPNVTNQTNARQLARDLLPELSNLIRTRYRGAPVGG